MSLREFVTWNLKCRGALPDLRLDRRNSVVISVVVTFEAMAQADSALQVVRVDLPFRREDGSVRYASGRSFFHADDDHLSSAGVEQVRGIVTVAIASSLNREAGSQRGETDVQETSD